MCVLYFSAVANATENTYPFRHARLLYNFWKLKSSKKLRKNEYFSNLCPKTRTNRKILYIWINFVFKLNLIIYIFARATYSGVSCAKTIVLATATRKSCVLPRAKLDFCFASRAENLCYQNKTDKTSCRNFARLSAWWKLGGTPAPDVLRLRKISAYSKRSYTRYLFIRKRNWSRKATTGRSSVIAVKAIVLCHSEKWNDVGIP